MSLESVPVGLELADDHPGRAQLVGDLLDVGSRERPLQPFRVADHTQNRHPLGRGQPGHRGVADAFRDRIHVGTAGLVVERHDHDGRDWGRRQQMPQPPSAGSDQHQHDGDGGAPGQSGARHSGAIDQPGVVGPVSRCRKTGGGVDVEVAGIAAVAIDRGDEPVTDLGHGDDVARGVGGIAECASHLGDAEVQSALEVDVGALAPDLALQRLAGHGVTGPGEQHREDAGRLGLQLHWRTVAPQGAARRIELVDAKPNQGVAQRMPQSPDSRALVAECKMPALSSPDCS